MNSRINLDEILGQLPQWNLVLSIGGVDYPIRELRIGDLQKLQPDSLGKGSEMADFIGSLFEGKRPDVNEWSLDMLGIVVGRIGAYVQERSKLSSQIASRSPSPKHEAPN
ncbi:MAG TPA: hypothetical protein VGG19_12275 [Tepidisphaeraceae bacterium]|jgi:hypothetical protein